jgi:hypothetical protein
MPFRMPWLVALGLVWLLPLGCVPRPASLATRSAVTAIAAAAPTAEPGPSGPTPVPSFVRPTPLPDPTFLAYIVKRGDTLTSIARAFGMTSRSIAFWSRTEHPSLDPLSDGYRPDRLEIGWNLLLIPDATFDEDELPGPTPSATPAPNETPSATAS